MVGDALLADLGHRIPLPDSSAAKAGATQLTTDMFQVAEAVVLAKKVKAPHA